jgi:hypothetical protein
LQASQRVDLVGLFTAAGQFPIGQQFIAVQLDPSLHEPQLLPWQLARQNLAVVKADGRLECRRSR